MFGTKTTIILGAGFSYELGMPLGEDLKAGIARILELGRNEPFQCPPKLSSAIGNRQRVCLEIIDALGRANSIDALVEFRKSNIDFVECAKIGIVGAILKAESASKIGRSQPPECLTQVQKSALRSIFNIIWQKGSDQDLLSPLKNVAIINFNYDRCFEFYFLHALANLAGINISESARALSQLLIWHPYGTVGDLPDLPGRKPGLKVPFGADFGQQDLKLLSSGIQTYSESLKDVDAQRQMHEWIQTSGRVIMLGAAPHPQNLELIRPKATKLPQQSYATCLKIPPSGPAGTENIREFTAPEANVFKSEFQSWVQSQTSPAVFPLTCYQLASMYEAEWSR